MRLPVQLQSRCSAMHFSRDLSSCERNLGLDRKGRKSELLENWKKRKWDLRLPRSALQLGSCNIVVMFLVSFLGRKWVIVQDYIWYCSVLLALSGQLTQLAVVSQCFCCWVMSTGGLDLHLRIHFGGVLGFQIMMRSSNEVLDVWKCIFCIFDLRTLRVW